MKALVVVPHLAARGGAERYAAYIAASLQTRGWEVTVATREAASVAADGSYFGIDLSSVRGLDLPNVPARLPAEAARLWRDATHTRILRREKADLFVFTGFRGELPGVGGRSVYLCHFPHRLSLPVRGASHAAYMTGMRVARNVFVNSGLDFRRTYDTFVANSHFTAAHMHNRWGVEPMVLEPPCPSVPTTDVEKRRIILNVGRFEPRIAGTPHKSQDILVREFLGLADLHDQGWELHLAGTVSQHGIAFYESLRRMAGASPVRFHPNIAYPDLVRLYGEASIYWHAQGFGTDPEMAPETQEHFGMTTVEAMSAGIIPVVINTAGPAEVTRNLPGVGKWNTLPELRAETRRVAGMEPFERAHVAAACRDRAFSYSLYEFERKLDAIIEGLATVQDRRENRRSKGVR